MSSYTQKRLSKAWKMEGCTLEELCEGIEAMPKTAIMYQRMVKLGVTRTQLPTAELYEEVKRRMVEGWDGDDAALSLGLLPKSLVLFHNERPEDDWEDREMARKIIIQPWDKGPIKLC